MSTSTGILLVAFILLTAVTVGARVAPEASPRGASGGFFFEDVTIGETTMRGVIYVPAGLDPAASHPGILFMHGYGECGTDGTRHLTVGLPRAIMQDPANWPFVVIMPQKPEFAAEWEDFESHLLALLDRASDAYGVDPARMAVTGLSQGGHGTIALASRHPDRFVAAIPVCPYVERWNEDGAKTRVVTPPDSPELAAAADALAAMPVRLFHGAKDTVTVPSESHVLHDALLERGGDVEMTIFPEDDHNSWDSTYQRSGIWTWLASVLEAGS